MKIMIRQGNTNLVSLMQLNLLYSCYDFLVWQILDFLEMIYGRKSENQLAKLALVAMAAGVLTLGSVDPAAAAKTGGRVGGQAFKSSAPRASGPRINNSR